MSLDRNSAFPLSSFFSFFISLHAAPQAQSQTKLASKVEIEWLIHQACHPQDIYASAFLKEPSKSTVLTYYHRIYRAVSIPDYVSSRILVANNPAVNKPVLSALLRTKCLLNANSRLLAVMKHVSSHDYWYEAGQVVQSSCLSRAASISDANSNS